MKIFRVVILHLIVFSITGAKFKMYTFLYNETNQERAQEYITCLETNLNHESIGSVCIAYDTSRDEPGDTPLLDYLKKLEASNQLSLVYIKSRPTYGYFFNLVNKTCPNERIILCNADIYFNDSLKLLDNFAFKKDMMLVLTRWNVTPDGELKQFHQHCRPEISSQDVWVFQSPIRRFNDDLTMGILHCDSKFAFRAYHAGFKLYNPCLDIQCCHYHLSDIRNYHQYPGCPGSIMRGTPWIKLDQIK